MLYERRSLRCMWGGTRSMTVSTTSANRGRLVKWAALEVTFGPLLCIVCHDRGDCSSL